MFELPGARGLPQGRARLRRARDRAARRAVGPRPPLPGRARARDGRARPVRPRRPRGVRRRAARDFTIAVRRDRGARPRRPVDRHHARGRRRPRHQPDPHLRHRRAEAALAARPRRRPRARRLRPDRARGRLGRRRHPHPRRARRTASGSINGAKAFITNSGTDITSVVTVTARTGTRRRQPRSRAIMVPGRHARLHRRAGLRQARLARLRHPRPDLRRLPGAGGEPARRARARASRSSSPILDDGRIAISALAVGLRPGLPRAVACDYANERHDLRRADRRRNQGVAFPLADLAVVGRGGPAAHLQGGLAQGRRPARPRRSSRRRRSPSSTRPRRRSPPPASRPRSSAATASWRSTRSPASTATPRSSRSARARPRCSAWSSPAASACRSQ